MYQLIPLQRDYLCEISLKANVANDAGNNRNETWTLNKEMKLEYLYKTKFALRASWNHGLIAQSVRMSEQNSVVVGSNSTQANFL